MIEFNDYKEVITLLDKGIRAIGAYSDTAVDAEMLLQDLEEDWPFNQSRREYCEFVGVGESTLTGWLKHDRIPKSAKIAHVLLNATKVLVNELKHRDQLLGQPKVVFDGNTYQIVLFTTSSDGTEIGQILARDIGSHQAACVFAESLSAFRMLQEALQIIDEMFVRTENPAYIQDLEDLKHRIIEKTYMAFDPALLEKIKGRQYSLREVLDGNNSDRDLEKHIPAIILKDFAASPQDVNPETADHESGDKQ